MTTATQAAPLFGVSLTPERQLPFRLMSYGPRDPETGKPRETIHAFTARAEVDAATAIGALRGGAAAQAGVMTRFLQRVLLDDDGVSVRDVPRPVRIGEDGEPEDLLDDDDPSSPGTELQLAGYAELADTEWELDGRRFPSRNLAEQHAREHGSSLRRFADLMDNQDGERVKLDALREIVNYLAKESSGRPTAPSTRSPKRPTRRKAR